MAIQSIEITLVAGRKDARPISSSSFLTHLVDVESAVEASADRGSWMSAKVVLARLWLAEYEDNEGFENALSSEVEQAAVWLSKQVEKAFDVVRGENIDVFILFDLVCDLDQIDLEIPASFLSQSGRLGLRIKILTND